MTAKPKKIYTRAELCHQVEKPDGFVIFVFVCGLCGGTNLETELIEHEDDCPLKCPEVLGVTVFAMTRARDIICGDCPNE